MKKIKFEDLKKGLIIILILYITMLLTIIAFNSSTGRYQFDSSGYRIIDTKTGRSYIWTELNK